MCRAFVNDLLRAVVTNRGALAQRTEPSIMGELSVYLLRETEHLHYLYRKGRRIRKKKNKLETRVCVYSRLLQGDSGPPWQA